MCYNCSKNVSEHAKIVFEKVEKSWKKSWKQVEKNLKKIWKNESTRIWCPKIMTWKKLKSDQEEEQQQTYVKDPEQECPRSKKRLKRLSFP